MIYPDQIIKCPRRTLSLSINKDGVVLVRAPSRMKDQDIKKFVESKQNWIISKLSQIQNNQEKYTDVLQMKKFLMFGVQYGLAIADVKKVEIINNNIVLPKKITNNQIMHNLILFYKKKAKEILSKRLYQFQNIMKIECKTVKISNSKGRWGSCSSTGVISLNWRVIMLTPSLIDYVLVHELCHLIEMNHSKRFWTLVETFLPEVNLKRQEIKDYSFLLELYREG